MSEMIFLAILDKETREALEKAGVPPRELSLFEDLVRVVLHPSESIPDDLTPAVDYYLSSLREALKVGKITFDEYSYCEADLNLILTKLKELEDFKQRVGG